MEQRIREWVLLREVGRGGMGVVYEARHALDDGRYAIKVIAPHLAREPSVRERFLREIRTARRMRHPNIIETEAPFEHEAHIYLPMVFLEGPTLDERIRQRAGQPFPEADVLSMYQQAAEGLAYAHRAGILHRDIKPANLHVDAQGHLRILDFGLAKAVSGDTLTEAGAFLGTPVYLSPEYIESGKSTPAGDVFALGLVAFQLATGQRAVPEVDMGGPLLGIVNTLHKAHQKGLPAPRELRPELSARLDSLIRHALASEASCRFPDGYALAAAFAHPDPDALFGPDGRYLGPTRSDAPTLDIAHDPALAADPSPLSVGAPTDVRASPGPSAPPTAVEAEAALKSQRGGGLWIGLGLVLAAGLAAGWWASFRGGHPIEVVEVLPADTGSSPATPSDAGAVPDTGSGEAIASVEASPMIDIAAGSFVFGCGRGDGACDPDERPSRMVDLEAFSIDRTEVSVGAYRACVDAGGCTTKGLAGSDCLEGNEGWPVACVDREQARAYCRWAGKRLPTEQEWERAARGVNGRIYPWGRRASCAKAQVKGCGSRAPVDGHLDGASPEGALNMAGNVWEWVETDGAPMVRGGSYQWNARAARSSNRHGLPAETHAPGVGFRCAR